MPITRGAPTPDESRGLLRLDLRLALVVLDAQPLQVGERVVIAAADVVAVGPLSGTTDFFIHRLATTTRALTDDAAALHPVSG